MTLHIDYFFRLLRCVHMTLILLISFCLMLIVSLKNFHSSARTVITLLSFTSLSRYSYISAFRTHFCICVESYGSRYHRQTIPKIPKPSMKINRKLLDSNRKPILWSYLSNGNLYNHNNNGLKMSVNLTKFNTYSNLNLKALM